MLQWCMCGCVVVVVVVVVALACGGGQVVVQRVFLAVIVSAKFYRFIFLAYYSPSNKL